MVWTIVVKCVFVDGHQTVEQSARSRKVSSCQRRCQAKTLHHCNWCGGADGIGLQSTAPETQERPAASVEMREPSKETAPL